MAKGVAGLALGVGTGSVNQREFTRECQDDQSPVGTDYGPGFLARRSSSGVNSNPSAFSRWAAYVTYSGVR